MAKLEQKYYVTSPRAIIVPNMGSIDVQNKARLRVNRIAIVQDLKVEHVLEHLQEQNVIDMKDVNEIESGTTHQDKARLLLDVLSTKEKGSDWYKHFRYALVNAKADAATRKTYHMLVEFLDNTIIKPKTSPRGNISETDQRVDLLKFPKYSPLPNISPEIPSVVSGRGTVTFNVDESPAEEKGELESRQSEKPSHSEEKTPILRATSVPAGSFELKAPENYTSLLEYPVEHARRLEESPLMADKMQLADEEEVFRKMQQLEVAYALHSRHQLPCGSLLMSQAAQDFLFDRDCHHLYMKYFDQLKKSHYIDIAKEFVGVYALLVETIENPNTHDSIMLMTKICFNLVYFLQEFGYFPEAEKILVSFQQYLSKYPGIESWKSEYDASVLLMTLCNNNYDFNRADNAYYAAMRASNNIEMVAFGKDILDQGEQFLQNSIMLREIGSIGPAYMWIQKAMMEVEPSNHHTIINVLCESVLTYSAKANLKKAEELAIQAVRQAKEFFGTNHPQYLKALLHYCYFSNECRQDTFGVDAAKDAVVVALKIYGMETLHAALAYRALAKALIVCQDFSEDLYLSYAQTALQIAMDNIPSLHPKLSLFRHTLATCLQWKAVNALKDERVGPLIQAEAEAKAYLNTTVAFFGDISLKSAQGHSLLGQIYIKMDRYEEAEEKLKMSLEILKLCQPHNSYYAYMAKATYGTFCKLTQRPEIAIDLLKDVVDNVDCGGMWQRWIEMCFETLISLLRDNGQQTEAQHYQGHLLDFNREMARPKPVTWDVLDAKPEPWEKFLQEGVKQWQTKVSLVKEGIAGMTLNALNST
ncbi:amyloid protein-binding protein 2 isoform X1 [Lingula anatina]|uniref:Amyloid protein-binding protein 2 isoform X1 n=2 Tax=Lingula anatina TaxID=7574 RepID=A0A1S3ICK8_LINAN|nr:amyloid protein-binding protein 2 isoform X1 [Lingula anatina]|eukprot:XP_013395164.1 amyloid protein-binding protein 2 isoform X1 [Lingula anatina]